MRGLSCVPRSEQWNDTSRMTVGVLCSVFWQYHRRRSAHTVVDVSKWREETEPGLMERERRTDGRAWSYPLDDDADRVGVPTRVVRRVPCCNVVVSSLRFSSRARERGERTWEQEHLALADRDLAELAALDPDGLEPFLGRDALGPDRVVDDLERHVALVLEEPFLQGGEEGERGQRLERRERARETKRGRTHLGLVQMVVWRVQRISSARKREREAVRRTHRCASWGRRRP